VLQNLPPNITPNAKQIFVDAYFAGVESLATTVVGVLERDLVPLLPTEDATKAADRS
jgi:hypothetical protein